MILTICLRASIEMDSRSPVERRSNVITTSDNQEGSAGGQPKENEANLLFRITRVIAT
jgi:hypothetical protein